MRTSDVLHALRSGEWYGEILQPEDFRGVYPHSRKSIFDTTIKFSRKDLTLKMQLLPIGEECQQGLWKLTPLGRERAIRDGGSWTLSLPPARLSSRLPTPKSLKREFNDYLLQSFHRIFSSACAHLSTTPDSDMDGRFNQLTTHVRATLPLNFRHVDLELLDFLEERATIEGCTITSLVRKILFEYAEREKQKISSRSDLRIDRFFENSNMKCEISSSKVLTPDVLRTFTDSEIVRLAKLIRARKQEVSSEFRRRNYLLFSW